MSGKAVALECEVMRNNVRVNSIHPGFVDTPALRKHIDDATKAGHGRGLATIEPDEVAKTAVPIGVACTSEEVGEMVRSEEHTSELQSLMRISYAVFCLKKTKEGKN